MKEKTDEQDEMATILYANLHKVSQNLRNSDLPQGFTPERLRTLATIHTHGPVSITRLAELERLRPATISRMVSSLESDGFIKRRGARDDKRSVLISITPRGRQLYMRASQRYLERLSDAIAALDSDQIKLMHELASLLAKLGTAMET